MKVTKIKLVAMLSALLFGGPFFAHAKKVTDDLCKEGRIIVSPRAGLPAQALEKILGEHGGKGNKVGQSDLYIVDLPGRGSEQSVAARLKHNPHLKFAEVDCRVESEEFIPNDGGYPSAWHLPKIGASFAWETSQGAGVTIAILDSGVDGNHPDLAASMVPGWNFYDNNSITSDVFGHGTKVAGAAAAITNNAVGISGIAGQAKIMPIRVSGINGSATISTIVRGVTWAADNRARVANVSFNGVAGSASIQSAGQYLKSKGGLLVVAAGNNSIDEGYLPSEALVAVSATDPNDSKAPWSSYGSFVDFGAPGVNVLTTVAGGGYSGVHGTSFASPVTAGVVALMMSANPQLSNTDIERLLCASATDIGPMGKDIYYGCGRVNAAAAVEAVRLATPTPDLQAPLVDISSPVEGEAVSGLVPVNVTATDNVGVARVELRVNNNPVAIDTSAPFGFSWDSKGIPNGPATLIAYAVDEAGNTASSDPVNVTVSNVVVTPVKDTTPPVIKIVNPVPGVVSGNIPVTVNVSDNNGAAGVKTYIYIDGQLKASGSGSTVSYNWQTKKEGNWSHRIMVQSMDAARNAAMAIVDVTVRN